MKFCYLDESGTGDEPYAVMAGVVVDTYRMNVTKYDWQALLDYLSELIGRPVPEIHTRDFYPGNGVWRGLDGPKRGAVISAVFNWLKDRKHRVVFSAVDKALYREVEERGEIREGIQTLWQCLGLHIALALQKKLKTCGKNKGNTLLVFDRETSEEAKFPELVKAPPAWTDEYYGHEKEQRRLNQIIDVPYFADSKHVGLIQMADVAAFFLRRYIEIKTDAKPPKYEGEEDKVAEWVALMCERHISTSAAYPKMGRNPATDFFWTLAPDCIRCM